MLRSPVLIVSDPSFNQLYGPFRFRLTWIRTNLELFRRVIPVTVAESAGPDLVALAVESVSKTPGVVIFPYRYLEGARTYKENHEKATVLVMLEGHSMPGEESALVFVLTDTVQDLYRAGVCAASLAEDKKILFFYDGYLRSEYTEAFQEGLKSQGFSDYPSFINVSMEYNSYSEVGCVVIAGPATKFLERNLKIPVILFSWIDPLQVPRNVKLVFDDSPWALAVEIIKALPGVEAEMLIPSKSVIVMDREEKLNFRNIGALIKEKFEKN